MNKLNVSWWMRSPTKQVNELTGITRRLKELAESSDRIMTGSIKVDPDDYKGMETEFLEFEQSVRDAKNHLYGILICAGSMLHNKEAGSKEGEANAEL